MINYILDYHYCINPMPGVATHCKENEMTPLVKWNYIWDGITIK